MIIWLGNNKDIYSHLMFDTFSSARGDRCFSVDINLRGEAIYPIIVIIILSIHEI